MPASRFKPPLTLSQYQDRYRISKFDRMPGYKKRKTSVVLATMSTAKRPPPPKKRPPPWRKSEDVELAEELRDLELDIAKHSQPEMQESQNLQTSNPASTLSSTRRRQRSTFATKPAPVKTVQKQPQVIDLTKDICDLEPDTRAPSLAKDGGSQRPDWP